MLFHQTHPTVSVSGNTESDWISKHRWAEPSAVLGHLILDSLQDQIGPTVVLFISFLFILIKAKHFLQRWMIANTLGSSRYLHGWCPCHIFGLVKNSKPRAAQFLRDTVLHEISKMVVFEWKKPSYTRFVPPGAISSIKWKWSRCHQGWCLTESQPGLHGFPGCRGLQATLLDTSFWLKRSWPVSAKRDSLRRSRMVTLPCGHIDLCCQEAPVPCFHRGSVLPG